MDFSNLDLSALGSLLQDAYALLDKYDVSVSMVIGCAVLFFFTLFFATREAMAWFFKVHAVRRDVRRLRDRIQDLEGEIRLVQELLKAQIGAPARSARAADDDAASDSVERSGRIALRDEPKGDSRSKGAFKISH